jgi:hypothetical protein
VSEEGSISETSPSAPTWHRYEGTESIACVLASLDKDPIIKDVVRSFESLPILSVLENRTWSNALLKHKFPLVARILASKVNGLGDDLLELPYCLDGNVGVQVQGGYEVCHLRLVCPL